MIEQTRETQWTDLMHADPFRQWFVELDDPFARVYAELLPDLDRLGGVFETDLDCRSALQALAPAAIIRFQDAQRKALQELTQTIRDVDPLPLICGLMLLTKIRPWGTYYEPHSVPVDLDLELVTGIIASCSTVDLRPANVDDLKAVASAMLSVRRWAHAVNTAYSFAGDGDPKATLRDELLTRWLIWRGMAYTPHARAVAKSLAAEYESVMFAKAGFRLEDLVDVADAIHAQWERRISATLEAAWEYASSRTSENPEHVHAGSENFQDRWYEEAMRLLPNALAVPMDGLPHLLNDSRVDREVAVLRALGVRPGDCPAVESVLVDPPQRTRPFLLLPTQTMIEGNDGRGEVALLVNPGGLTADFHLTTESFMSRLLAAKADRWRAARARAVDRHATSLIHRALPGSSAFSNVFIDGPDGREEVDGIVVFDDIVILIEGKGAPLNLKARRGSVDKLLSQFRELITHGWRQLERDRAFVLGGRPAKFYTEAGNCVLEINRDEIRRCYKLLPCLDGFVNAGTVIHQLVDLDILPADAYAWILSLTDLHIVLDILRRPAELVGYMEFRERWTRDRRLRLLDEIEVLDLYRHQLNVAGLLAKVPDGGRAMFPPSQATYDRWYHGQAGLGPVVDRPKVLMHPRMRRFVDELQRTRPDGWLASATAAMQVPREVLRVLGEAERGLADQARQDGFSAIATDEGEYTLMVRAQGRFWSELLNLEDVRSLFTSEGIKLLLRQRGSRLHLEQVLKR